MLRRLVLLLPLAGLCAPTSLMGQQIPATNDSPATIRANTDLVMVDVVASDGKQDPIHGLATANFTVFEDGKPQAVKVFEEHQPGPPAAMPPMPKLSRGMFTNFTATPESGPLNILLFDKLNTPVEAQSVVRDQVLKYLREAPPGTRMAIFGLTTQLKLLQGFTSNPELLRAIVEGKKGNSGASVAMNNVIEGDHPGADDPSMDMVMDAMGNKPNGAALVAELQQFEAEQKAFQIQLRQQYTLDALNQLARYLSMMPGRKNLIWFSGSFPISILPDPDLKDPFANLESAEREFRQTVSLLSRSQVAVYPIDARGLMTQPTLNASQSGSTFNRGSHGFADANYKWMSNTFDEHSTMQQMAQATGGKAFYDDNGLKEAVDKAVATGSNYYTLAYEPSNREWNGAYRKIEVKVDRPGVSLAYRLGYFADDLKKSPRGHEDQTAAQVPAQYDALRSAMQHGAPDPTQLILVADVRPSTVATEMSPAQGNQPGKKLSGPFRRYACTFLAKATQVNCGAGADGTHHCSFGFVTVVYDGDGKAVNQQTNSLNFTIPADKFAEAMNRDLAFRQEISVPVKGEYFLRIGMRDDGSDRVGAVEVPIAAVANLPPLAQTANPAQPAAK